MISQKTHLQNLVKTAKEQANNALNTIDQYGRMIDATTWCEISTPSKVDWVYGIQWRDCYCEI